MTEEQIEKGMLSHIKQTKLKITEKPCLNQDLSFNLLKTYLTNNGNHINEKSFNVNYHLLTEDGKFNEMAFLLADENDISIKVAIFSGNDKSVFLKRNEYGGKCLIASLNRVLDYFEAINDTYVEVGAHVRKEKKMFNFDVFKEAWINACVHNSWIEKTPPAVYVFDNRAEIVSIGSIPTTMTKEQFLAGESRPVNDELMRIFMACGIVEQSGHGVTIITREYGETAYSFEGDFVKVIIPFDKNGFVETKTKNDTASGTVNGTVKDKEYENSIEDKEQNILNIIRTTPKIQYSQLSKITNIPRRTLARIIQTMKEEGKIERVGSDKNGYWKII